MLTAIQTHLTGKKTYGQVAIGLALIAGVTLGWFEIPNDLYQQLINALTLGAIATLRAGVSK